MMRQNSALRSIAAAIFFAAILVACEKETFNTKPTLKFDTAGSYDVSQGQLLTFRLKVTDKEGDISDSLWIRAYTRRCPAGTIFFPYKVPDFPAKKDLNAEINITYLFNRLEPSIAPIWGQNLCAGVDTAIFQFYIRDLDGNVSDTIESDKPILLRNS